MIPAEMNKDFVAFLKKHRVYERFMKNKNIENPSGFYDAFEWVYSPEGYEFWYDLAVKWKKRKGKKNENISKIKYKNIYFRS
jgi:hypothetical protein